MKYLSFGLITSLLLLLISCSEQKSSTPPNKEALKTLTGTWTLKARIVDGAEVPAKESLLRLIINGDRTFRADFRSDESHKWVKAGQGAASFDPPFLKLYWELQPPITLLAHEKEPGVLLIHRGRNLAPLKDQDADELYVKQTVEKGPTR